MKPSFNTETFNFKTVWPTISLMIMTLCCTSGVITSYLDKNYSALIANVITYLWVLNWYISIKTMQKLQKLNSSYEKLVVDVLTAAKQNLTNESKN